MSLSMARVGRVTLWSLPVALLFVLGACGGDAWPEVERQAFMENCESTSGGETSYCECALEKAQETVADPNSITIGQMTDIAEDCSSEL